MRLPQVSSALGLVYVLETLVVASAVGRAPPGATSLRATFHTNSNANVVDQGPSPAELEEQEEEEGTQEPEADASQASPQQVVVASPPQLSEQASPSPPRSSSQLGTFASPQNVAPAPESVPPSLSAMSASSVPSLPSLIADGVGGASLTQTRKEEVESIEGEDADMETSATVDTGSAAPKGEAFPLTGNLLADMGSSARVDAASTAPQGEAWPVTVPGIASPLSNGDGASSRPVFPPAVPAKSPADAGETSLLHADPKKSMPKSKEHTDCHPPCIQGRGTCNDKMCFCKSPFTGTTCQHKVSTLARFSYAMLVAFSVVSLVLGVLFAQIVHAWITSHFEKRLAWLGGDHAKQEVWCPPENKKKPAA